MSHDGSPRDALSAGVSDADRAFAACCACPVLGVGIGLDVFDDRPDFRTLVASRADDFDFIEVYTRGDHANSAFLDGALPDTVARTYHHEGLDPVGPGMPDPDAVSGCALNIARLGGVPWVVEELAVRHIDGRYTDFFFPALLTRDGIEATVRNLRALQARTPAPLLPENAPYEFAVGDVPLPEFLTEVSHRAGMGIVLDIGHLLSWQLCHGRGDDPLHGIERLDLSRVIEVHLAGARFDDVPGGGRIYRDIHGAGPIPDVAFAMLAELAPGLTNMRALTVEVETASEQAACDQVAQAREAMARVRPDFLAAAAARREAARACGHWLGGARGTGADWHRTLADTGSPDTPADANADAPDHADCPRHAAAVRAVGALFYREQARADLYADGAPPCDGLTAEALATLRAVPRARLERVVELHAGDFGESWYRPRLPATWLALTALHDGDEGALVRALTASAAFDSRINDDADGRALAGFIGSDAVAGVHGEDAPWLGELVLFEALLAGMAPAVWPDATRHAVASPGGQPACAPWRGATVAALPAHYDVAGIRECLLDEGMFPEGEAPAPAVLLVARATGGDTIEAAARFELAPAFASLLADGRHSTPDAAPDAPSLSSAARAMLDELASVARDAVAEAQPAGES